MKEGGWMLLLAQNYGHYLIKLYKKKTVIGYVFHNLLLLAPSFKLSS